MKKTVLLSKDHHQLLFFEFISPQGKVVTYFFQVTSLPDTSLGCFDTFEEAYNLMKNSIALGGILEKKASFFTGILENS
jgi:hypothetical protein